MNEAALLEAEKNRAPNLFNLTILLASPDFALLPVRAETRFQDHRRS